MIQMIPFLASGELSSTILVVLAVICATRAPRKQWSIAILCSMTGALPGLAVLMDCIRELGQPWPALPPPPVFRQQSAHAVTAVAFLVAAVLVPISYYAVPPRLWPRRWELLRLFHVAELLTWFVLLGIASMACEW